MTWSQASNIFSHGNSTTNGNHTQVANTLLINVNHNNYDESAARPHSTAHFDRINDRISTAIPSKNEMNHTQFPKIQTGEFIYR